MNLFEIDDAIQALIDPETGEVADYDAFQELQMQFENKIENTVLYIKELRSFAKELKEQKDSFEKRYKTVSNQAERLTEYVRLALGGNKFETAMCRVSPRNYTAIVIDDEQGLIDWAKENGREDLLSIKDPEVSRSAVSDAIKMGKEIPFCHTEQRQSIIVR